MEKTVLRRIGWVSASLGLTTAIVGCSNAPSDASAGSVGSGTSESQGYLDTTNGLNAINGFNATNGLNAINGLNATNGLNAANGLASINGFNSINGLNGTNGFNSVNGFNATNGLNAINGLNAANGLNATNGLASQVGLMTTDAGRKTVSYMVRCALAAGDSLVKQDQNGANYTFAGGIGLAPGYKTGGCAKDCLEQMSSCLMAHINTAGVHIPLWMTSPDQAIGWGQSPWFPNREGTFFGQMMLTNAANNVDAYYCNGPGMDKSVVPGRLGSTQGNVPYANAYPTSGGDCDSHCSMQATGDGALSCPGNGITWTHPITVWRGQTFQAESAQYTAPVGVQACTPATNCGGGQRVSWIRAGSGLTLNGVNVASNGTNQLVVYYTNGDPVGSPTRTLAVSVNGGPTQLRNFDATGADWNTVASVNITLDGFKAGGDNTIYFGGTSSAQAPDLDWFEVINTPSQSVAITSTTSFGANQLYRLIPLNSPLQSVDVAGNIMSNGTQIDQYASNTSSAQKFFIRDVGAGTFNIVSGNSQSFCFDDPAASTTNGAITQLYSCNNTNAQRWQITADPTVPGTYSLRNAAAGKCLDETSGSQTSGTKMQLWDCVSNNNQRFFIVPASANSNQL